jgi:hypothetical protein
MADSRGVLPTYTLRRVAAMVIALSSLLPLLLFAYTLYLIEAIGRPLAQLMLGLALIVALIGVYIFSAMMARLSSLLREATVAAYSEEPDPRHTALARGFDIPGIGRVAEAHPVTATSDQLAQVWKPEAELLVGQPVLISVMNAPDPIAGTLVQVTEDGLLLEQEGRQLGITYRRISAVERDRTAAR